MLFFLIIFITVFFPWVHESKAMEPERTEVIGYYTAGCIKNAVTLPADGTGYQVIRLSRKRYYGHPNLIQYIQSLGKAVATSLAGTLLIGDLSQKNGGPLPDDHNSHQTGLDADILFWQHSVATRRILTWEEREQIQPLSLLRPDYASIDSFKWDSIHGGMLKLAAASEEVDRVFVNPLIKRTLCKTYRGEEWLRKIRPWWGHDGHFHVRLRCPDDSPLCESQPPVSVGDGCDADLEWWFTEEAKKPKPKAQRPLPKECLSILTE
jgi:penicillin-insensitive murein endopeptidase